MTEFDAYAVADRLDELGRRLELTGESSFKVRAYHKSAEVLRALKTPLGELIQAGKLEELPGVGKAIAEKIETLHRSGTHKTLERLRQEVPDGLLDLAGLPGLGAKKVLQLRKELGVDGLDALERAIDDGRVEQLKGFGAKLASSLKDALAFARRSAGRQRMPEAAAEADAALEAVRAWPGVERAEAAGEVRRRCETTGPPSLVVCAAAGARLQERLGAMRVRAARPDRFGLALLYETGSEAHLQALETRAKERGLQLGSDGLKRGGEDLPAPDEAAVYAALGLPFIPPELREGQGEVEAAAAGRLPRLVEDGDLRGILHAHTTFSDGNNTLEEMAETVRGMGLEYFGVADHSQSARYAGGLSPERVARQHEEADRLNAKYAAAGLPFRILKGIESDIREDGSLDYDDATLAKFDFVVASVHSQFHLPREAQTARIGKALAHPATTILGHATGRLLLRREGYTVDVERILEACAEHGVVVEINAHPVRLDLDWRWHRRALELGAWLSINPDSHNTAELKLMPYGVAVARKGGVGPERVLNALGLAALRERLAARKRAWAPA
ncbi:MAG: PHP domain-containing protein [Planctomycetota bacterium]|nr:PHP domain-containing protein [Planctomycetota bacterium]